MKKRKVPVGINRTIKALFFLLPVLFTSCHKEWLDIKRSKKVVIPSNLKDLQALLDYTRLMNEESTPSLGEISANDFYLTTDRWQALSSVEQKNAYIWAKDIFGAAGEASNEWRIPYRQVFISNVVLEGLEKTDRNKDVEKWNNVKGSALFHRSSAFYQIAQLFCKPFTATAETDLGIPLRLESDINLKSRRATVKETYDRILTDLHASIELLPVTPLVKTRPSRPAAYALLARTYLQMENYDLALVYADSCLQAYSELMDYNEVDTASDYPFSQFNGEVIFHTSMMYRTILSSSRLIVDSALYRSYAENDLRKAAFFYNNNGMIRFKGSYDGSLLYFSGIATDELFLTRAECYARKGNVEKAMDDLNTLVSRRFENTSFTPFEASNPEEALKLILKERRKELVYRGIRFSDLRRLNKDPRFAATLTRVINGQTYTLPANDPKYVFPIPDIVIALNGMEQNVR